MAACHDNDNSDVTAPRVHFVPCGLTCVKRPLERRQDNVTPTLTKQISHARLPHAITDIESVESHLRNERCSVRLLSPWIKRCSRFLGARPTSVVRTCCTSCCERRCRRTRCLASGAAELDPQPDFSQFPVFRLISVLAEFTRKVQNKIRLIYG